MHYNIIRYVYDGDDNDNDNDYNLIRYMYNNIIIRVDNNNLSAGE